MKLVIIAAIAQNGVIGNKNDLPWKLRSDLKRFKEVTTGHTVLCGRKTYESIGRPLPNRKMVVVSRNIDFQAPGCENYTSLEMALWRNTSEEKVYCIGGAEIYKQALEFAAELDITRVLADVEGDTFFPYIGEDWRLVSETTAVQGENDEHPILFQKYVRRGSIYDEEASNLLTQR